ncbi:hypothetical protein [Terriglobus tenax]|uniref:hypothetical protein n=1 Tax=Terriglobus tenax TaxID=1111115 RepID=UPI0021E0A970|nr:hypothetical protein [Terriglobus tenax]
MKPAILVVEPQMEEHFHAPFNAAFLHSVACAYAEVPVSFRGFAAHVETVQGILRRSSPETADRISWETLAPLKSKSIASRWMHNRAVIRQALHTGRHLLFTSISRLQLLQLKSLMGASDRVCVTLHGDIDSLERPSRDRFPKSLYSMHRVVKMRNPAGLRYLFLSKSIYNHVPAEFRQAMTPAGIVDHPYHFAPAITGEAPRELIFGVFGNSGDGRLLEQVARQVKQQNPAVRFRLVGFVQDEETVQRLAPFVEDVTSKPIPRSLFIERATSLTHTLWLAPPDSYRLRASGAFFDVLAYAKPLVYTANPYVDPYFAGAPEMGVRCGSVDEVPAAILELAGTFTAESYRRSQQAILELRKRFTPEQLAKRLPNELGWGDLK